MNAGATINPTLDTIIGHNGVGSWMEITLRSQSNASAPLPIEQRRRSNSPGDVPNQLPRNANDQNDHEIRLELDHLEEVQAQQRGEDDGEDDRGWDARIVRVVVLGGGRRGCARAVGCLNARSPSSALTHQARQDEKTYKTFRPAVSLFPRSKLCCMLMIGSGKSA